MKTEMCKSCGLENREVVARLARWRARKYTGEKLDAMRLCDACASIGSVCSGRVDIGVKDVRVGELLAAIDAVVGRHRGGRK